MIGEKMSDKEKEIYNALKTVIDPELTVNLVDLGLIMIFRLKIGLQ